MTTYTTRKQVAESVARMVEEVGLTMDEFIDAGKADRLTDGDLRDLWLIYGRIVTGDRDEHGLQLDFDDGSWWASCDCGWFSAQPFRSEQDAGDEWADHEQDATR